MAKTVVCKRPECPKPYTPMKIMSEKFNQKTGQREAYTFRCPICGSMRAVSYQEAVRQNII